MIRAFIFLTLAVFECHGNHREKMLPHYNGCFETKGCFGLPFECVKTRDCNVLLTYTDIGNGILFKMSSSFQMNSYMAMGLSFDKRMGRDAVTECFWQGPKAFVRKSWNLQQNINHLIDKMPKNPSGNIENGVHTCSWVEDYVTDVQDDRFNLRNSSYHILLAEGPMDPLKEEKLQHSRKIGSQEAMNLAAYKSVFEKRTGDIPVEDFSESHGSTEESITEPSEKEQFSVTNTEPYSVKPTTIKPTFPTEQNPRSNTKSTIASTVNDLEANKNLSQENEYINNLTSPTTVSSDSNLTLSQNSTQSVKVHRRNMPFEESQNSTTMTSVESTMTNKEKKDNTVEVIKASSYASRNSANYVAISLLIIAIRCMQLLKF